MSSSKIFRANDVRGIYPSEINEQIVYEIAGSIKKLFKTVVVGHDARLSSPSLYEAVIEALKGKEVFEAGLITSPEMYFLVNELKADGGIMITASHNPKEYNGLKIMGKNAVPMSGKDVGAICHSALDAESSNLDPRVSLCSPEDDKKNKYEIAKNVYLELYVDFLKKHLNVKKPLRIVFDASNGVAGVVLKELFKGDKNIEAIFINSEPDGNFPGHGPNPLKEGALSQLQNEVKKQKADLGIVFDGDGDRVFFVDDKGSHIDPDIIGFILTETFKPPYVATTISSWRAKKAKKTVISKVGHLFMKLAMRENKANAGMERSGHYYFKDFFYCDSGIFAAIQVINFLSSLDKSISEYAEGLPKYYQISETNFEMKNEKWAEEKMAQAEKLYGKSALSVKKEDGLLVEFGSPAGEWWFSLRVSNSEYLLRLNMEATSKNLLDEKLEELQKFLAD